MWKYKYVAVAVILLLVATQTAGAALQNVTVLSAPPSIMSFAPPFPVRNNEGETRTFNISINQIVTVSWCINGKEVFTESGVNESAYRNTSVAGTWNVSAIASNPNGTTMHTWTWNVTHAPYRPQPGGRARPTPSPGTTEVSTPTPAVTPASTPPATPLPTPTLAPTPTPKEEKPLWALIGGWSIIMIAIAIILVLILKRRRKTEER